MEPTFVLTQLDATDSALEISYRINNNSDQEIWLCKNLGSVFQYFSSEVSMTDDGETLLVRRRLDVPITGFAEQVFGSFIRIPRASSLGETALFPLPVRPHRVTLPARGRDEAIKYVKRLRIEVGYYSGDLLQMISRMLEDAPSDPQAEHVDDVGYPTDAIGWFGNSIWFNKLNEIVPDRNKQVVIPWTNQSLKGEQVLHAVIGNLHVPYVEKADFMKSSLESLQDCTRAEVHYQPSLFEYLFPHPIQQGVLDYDERRYLQAQKRLLVEDPILISGLINGISKEKDRNSCSSCILPDRSTMAHVVCYRGHERLASFVVYDGTTIVTDDRRCYRYLEEPASIRTITSAIEWVEPFRLRVACAANLSTLWYRLRLYHQAERLHLENSPSGGQVVYPASERWCDAMLQILQIAEHAVKAYECPDAGEGPCTYAMNSNCEPDSPGDTVLLFETKPGWNQHGGPELFTFDNHEPKGGCVLLNDGTVKFIRTEEELHALRWK
ncbi:MAG: hypothetical protein GXY19_07575 [Phycisphaerae bacterium]|nr:hypothetical protein [Phycisphaerae bacterium]